LLRSAIARCTLILVSCLLTSGCVISSLKDDLAKLEARFHKYQGIIVADNQDAHGLVIVAVDDLEGSLPSAFKIVVKPGQFQLVSEAREAFLFAFEDKNGDFRFQAEEKFGWAMSGERLSAVDDAGQDIRIVIGSSAGPPLPPKLINKPLINYLAGNSKFHFGTVTSLKHDLLSLKQADKGLWQPFAFLEDGGTGIHFMEPFDSKRIPVLFVHGVQGSPANFAPLVENLDRSLYQAWYFSYPSGLRIETVARGLFQFVEIIHRYYKFDELHIVAHSMGGLASRGTVNICVANNACQYVQSLTTISTPWNGVKSVQVGMAWMPTVPPVWRDLEPASEFLATLFKTPLPDRLPHNLLFSYRQSGIFGNASGDGVIELSSQLREEAQDGATTVHGYDEGHVSILGNDEVGKMLNRLLGMDFTL
jgi:pimeloyl-ACP methyl ester carboxylesterase